MDGGLSMEEVSPGIHVLSNAKLDTPWPKVTYSFLLTDTPLYFLFNPRFKWIAVTLFIPLGLIMKEEWFVFKNKHFILLIYQLQ